MMPRYTPYHIGYLPIANDAMFDLSCLYDQNIPYCDYPETINHITQNCDINVFS